MTAPIAIIWWIGLIGALGATLTIVKEVALVLRTLGEIHRLAELTRGAARGIRANVEPLPRLAELSEPVRTLREAALALLTTGSSLERHAHRMAATTEREDR
jgi:hypothetical protein